MTSEATTTHHDQAAFDAARRILTDLIGYASEQAVTDSKWQARRDELVARWQALRVDDVDAVQRVLDQDAADLRRLAGLQ